MSITIPMQMSLCNVSYDVTSYDIQEGITHLNDFAFSHCRKLQNVQIPQTLSEVGVYCFSNCTQLEKIDLSKSQITKIPNYAFENCLSLKTVILPFSIKEIGENAFYNCEKLEKVVFTSPDLKKIGNKAFYCCEKLKDINLDFTSIENSSLLSSHFPAKIRNKGKRFFHFSHSSCSLCCTESGFFCRSKYDGIFPQ